MTLQLFNVVIIKKVEAVKILLKNGVDTHAQCRRNLTPFSYASDAKLYDIISVLEKASNK